MALELEKEHVLFKGVQRNTFLKTYSKKLFLFLTKGMWGWGSFYVLWNYDCFSFHCSTDQTNFHPLKPSRCSRRKKQFNIYSAMFVFLLLVQSA